MDMVRETGGEIGCCEPDNLIAKAVPSPDVFIVSLKTPGIIPRGTVLTREDDGSYEVLGNGTSGPASCIVAETTEEEDQTAVAYRSGHFYRNALLAHDETEIFADDENNLRLAGIFLSDGV